MTGYPPGFEIRTERVILRPMNVGDAEAMYAINAHPEVVRFTGEPAPENVDEVRARISSYPDYRDFGFGRWACVLRGSNEMIGFCGLKKLPELPGEVDIGYRLAPAHWGKGLATETALATLHFGFSRLGLPRIIALVLPENQRSIRVIEKMGMRYEDTVEYFEVQALRYVRLASDSAGQGDPQGNYEIVEQG